MFLIPAGMMLHGVDTEIEGRSMDMLECHGEGKMNG